MLSQSDIRVAGSYMVPFQIKSSFTLSECLEPNSRAGARRHVHTHMLPGVKQLERGLVFKREQLWRAVSWLFQQSKGKQKKKNHPIKAKGR